MNNNRNLLAGLFIYFVGVTWAAFGNGFAKPLPIDIYIFALVVAFIGYLVISLSVIRGVESTREYSIANRPVPIWMGHLMLVVAMAARLVTLAAPHRFNSDVSRYVWDGHLVCHAINPYQYPPADPHLDSVREPNLFSGLKEEFNQIRTVYGPVAMLFFASANRLPGDPQFNIRMIMVLGDVLAIYWLSRTLLVIGASQSLVALYGLNPLLIDSLAQRGQMEGILLPSIAFWLYCGSKQKWTAFGIATAVMILVKFNAVVLAVIAFAYAARNDRKGLFKFLGSFLLVSILGLSPIWMLGVEGISGVLKFAAGWTVNESLFFGFKFIFGEHNSRWICGVVFSIGLLFISRRTWQHEEFTLPDSALVAMWWLLLLSPAVFPWYLNWLLPMVSLSLLSSKRMWLLLSVWFWTMTSLLWYLNFALTDIDDVVWSDSVQQWVKKYSTTVKEPWRVIEYLGMYSFLLFFAVSRWNNILRDQTNNQSRSIQN